MQIKQPTRTSPCGGLGFREAASRTRWCLLTPSSPGLTGRSSIQRSSDGATKPRRTGFPAFAGDDNRSCTANGAISQPKLLLIGARPRIGGAIAGAESAGRGVIQTPVDAIAERRPRRRRVALWRQRIHLRWHRDFDPWRRRRWRHRRVELRTARRDHLRRSGARKHDCGYSGCDDHALCVFHRGYVVIPSPKRK